MTIYFVPKKNRKIRSYSFKQKRKKANVDLQIIDLRQIHQLLVKQRPNTFIISLMRGEINQYYLSYVREKDLAIVHVQFHKSFSGIYTYENGTFKKDVSINGIAEKIINYRKKQFLPRQYIFRT